jgi:hypothetical protein
MQNKKDNNTNSNNFMMGVGNGIFGNQLLFHLKNIEEEINQKIVKNTKNLSVDKENIGNNQNTGHNQINIMNSSQLFGKNRKNIIGKYNTPQNTFETLITKLETKVVNLNNQIKSYNQEKQDLKDMSEKEIRKLKDIINKTYTIVRILSKSMDLTNNNKNKLLEKLRKTIQESNGFLKSINEVSTNSTNIKETVQRQNNLKMSNIINNKNIKEVSKTINQNKLRVNEQKPLTVEQIEPLTEQPVQPLTEYKEEKNYETNLEKNKSKFVSLNNLKKNNNEEASNKNKHNKINELNTFYENIKNNKISQQNSTKVNKNIQIEIINLNKNKNSRKSIKNKIENKKISLQDAKYKLNSYI